jgi:arylsulfatase A
MTAQRTRVTCLRFQQSVLLGVLSICSHVAVAADAPNIVVILADDFGVGDIHAHYPDNKIATPHLDRLVRQGISFADAHSPSAVCSPTRYGLLTGRYAWRTRLQEWVIAVYEPPLIAADRTTLPGFLRDHGYHTSCVGKWHLGWNWPGPQPSQMTDAPNGQKSLEWDFTRPIAGGPIDRGFDDFFGLDLPNLPPFTWIQDDRVTIQPTDGYVHDPSVGIVLPRGFVGCPIAPDWKFDDILPEITRRAVRRVHDLAERDEPFFLFFSQTSPHEPVVPSEKFKGKSGIAPIADFVMETDWSAGQVIEAIDDAGVADNTIVIFTADNGHSHYTGWQELVDAGHQPSGPYRGHKGDIWEGGHRVPLIVRWPGRVAADTSTNQLVSLTDFFSTFAEVIDADLPEDAAEDSVSFLSAALGETNVSQRSPIISHSNHGEFACRDGDWKLVFRNRTANTNQCRGEPRIVELYNLDQDIAEQDNVSATHADVAERVTQVIEQIVNSGTSRPGLTATNDHDVHFDTTQTRRWASNTE